MEHQTVFQTLQNSRKELELLLQIKQSGAKLPPHLQKNLDYDIQDLKRTVLYLAGISKAEQFYPRISHGNSKAM